MAALNEETSIMLAIEGGRLFHSLAVFGIKEAKSRLVLLCGMLTL